MKLTQFAFAAIVVLLLVAGYLTVKSDLDSRQDAQNALNKELIAQVAELAKKQSAPVPVVPQPAAAVPEAPVAPALPKPPASPAATEALAAAAAIPPNAPLAPENDPRMMLEDERKVLNLGANDRVAEDSLTLPSTLDGQTLTAIQRRIAAAPPIARVKLYAVKEGMLVLDRGTNVGLKSGDTFALRRKAAAIGRIRISDTIDTGECVADILPNSMPPGMLPEAGDEVIQFEP